MMSRTYDLIVFGATGFTGKYVVETIVKTQKRTPDEPFSWAVSGRSVSKLSRVLKEIEARTGVSLKDVPLIEADTSSHESLTSMARQCKIVLNCVGPYIYFGEQVVKACLDEGTHHLDVSGEPQFLETMQLKYHKEAEEKGVYILGATAIESIPADCGSMYLRDNFGGDVNSIEEYLELDNDGKPTKFHYASWQTCIEIFSKFGELKTIRAALFPKSLPEPKHKIIQRSMIHYSNVVKGWCIPAIVPDIFIMERTQRFLYHEGRERPAQLNLYTKQKSLLQAIVFTLFGAIFSLMTQFRVGRYLLENYPRFFSLGYITKDDIAPEEMDNLKFTITLVGEGWDEKLSEPTDVRKEPPNKKKVMKIRGKNPGYGATCICLLQAALTVLKESSKLPSRGGVYTPGIAFRKTNLIQRLNKNGVTFSMEN